MRGVIIETNIFNSIQATVPKTIVWLTLLTHIRNPESAVAVSCIWAFQHQLMVRTIYQNHSPHQTLNIQYTIHGNLYEKKYLAQRYPVEVYIYIYIYIHTYAI